MSCLTSEDMVNDNRGDGCSCCSFNTREWSYKDYLKYRELTQPINWANYGKRMYEGNGELDKIFNNKEEAIKYVSTKVSVVNKNDMNFAIKQCKEKGLKQGTEEFADCALKNLKENN